MTIVLASFAQPCVLCNAKADHTIEVCDKRAARFAPPTTVAPAEPVEDRDICGRCAGTGQHISHILNGRPVPSGNGICFRCKGKGYQTSADEARNTAYDEYAAGKALAADMAIPATIQPVHPGTRCGYCYATSDHTREACNAAMEAAAAADPYDVYGTPEHEAVLMYEERGF